MGNLRPVLIIGLVFLGYMLWVQWQKDYAPAPQPPAQQSQPQTGVPSVPEQTPAHAATAVDLPEPIDSPQAQSGAGVGTLPGADTSPVAGPFVSVTTDVLNVEIDLVGGTVVSARLLDYPVKQKEPEIKIDLLAAQGDHLFIAQSGLLSHQEAPNHTSKYSHSATSYELADGESELRVPLTWKSETGIEVTKTFVFRPGEYEISVLHEVNNQSGESWSGSRYDQLQREVPGEEDNGGFSNPGRYSFVGIGFYNPEDKFEKIKFADVADEPYKKTTRDGWLAMIQHYFFAAWIPPSEEDARPSRDCSGVGIYG